VRNYEVMTHREQRNEFSHVCHDKWNANSDPQFVDVGGGNYELPSAGIAQSGNLYADLQKAQGRGLVRWPPVPSLRD
jgi:hypothetical protein